MSLAVHTEFYEVSVSLMLLINWSINDLLMEEGARQVNWVLVAPQWRVRLKYKVKHF